MARTIVVTVGISLVMEKVKEKEKAPAGFGKLGERPFPTLSALGEGLEREDQLLKSAADFNPELRKWVTARAALVEKLLALWANTDLDDEYKRAWSGAELASLSLLGGRGSSRDPLADDDRVILLASDTPSGKFCAETIAKALRKGVTGVTPGEVRVVDIAGLRADDAELFLTQGLPNTAHQLADFRTESLLIASGGYKGLLPYLTPIAMRLEIPLLYLYEESDRMLEIRSLEFPADLKLVHEFRRAFNRIDPSQGRTQEYAKAFWADVDAVDPHNGRARIQQKGLVSDTGDVVKLTATGVLARTLQLLTLPEG